MIVLSFILLCAYLVFLHFQIITLKEEAISSKYQIDNLRRRITFLECQNNETEPVVQQFETEEEPYLDDEISGTTIEELINRDRLDKITKRSS